MPETALKPHFSNYNSREQFPSFEKPHIIDGFSLGQDRSIAGSSRRNLKYLRLPDSPFDFDLNVGYESYVPGPKEVNITSLLQCIHHKKEVFLSSGKLSADFVCYRGLLTQILTSPYFSRDPWSIIATRYKGTIYLCSYTSPERTKRMQERETEYSNRCCYYGKNFERFIFTGDREKSAPIPVATDEPLQDTEEFDIALTTKLDGLRLLYAAEMDGVDDSQSERCDPKRFPLDTLNFVEVKTRMRDANENQYRNYLKFNLPKWWCQSFLVGVETIYAGLRSREGHVTEIETIPVRSIPKQCGNLWSPAIMMRFGSDFLSTVHDLMLDLDCPHTVWKFDYDSSRSWSVTYETFAGQNEFSFLPQSHIDLMSSKSTGCHEEGETSKVK